MTAFRRRRHRGGRKPAFTSDFRGDEAVTEVLERVRPADYDGRTYQWGGASSAGLPEDVTAATEPPAPWRPPGERFADPRTWRGANGICAAPVAVLTGRQAPWVMTIDGGAPAIPMDTRLQRARNFLELEVADLAAQGMLYRVDEAAQVRERGEELDDRSVIATTVAKAARHLLGPREPWDPR